MCQRPRDPTGALCCWWLGVAIPCGENTQAVPEPTLTVCRYARELHSIAADLTGEVERERRGTADMAWGPACCVAHQIAPTWNLPFLRSEADRSRHPRVQED